MPEIKVKRFSRSKTEAPMPDNEPSPNVSFELKNEFEPQQQQPMAYQSGDDFLANLTVPRFEQSQEEQKELEELKAYSAKSQKEADKALKRSLAQAEKERAKQQKQATKATPSRSSAPASDDDLFSNEGTQLLGKDRIILLTKVQQYKTLFPDKLKGFKIKKNPSVDDLKSYLEEMEVLVDVSTVDEFITESMLGCIKMVEGTTANAENYNITGLADMLKMNKQFHTLCKQLYIKYGCFNSVPPEYQLCMVIVTSSYICMCKNKSRQQVENYLNQPISAE